MKKKLEIETEKEKALNEVTEARNKLKLAELDLQLGQSLINRLQKIAVYTKTKPVAAIQSSSVPTNSKPPIVPLKTSTQNNIDDFPYTSPKFKTVIPITNQNKQSSFTRDSNNISNPDIETITQTPCLSLASENKCETSKIVAIDAFIDELIEGRDSQTDDSSLTPIDIPIDILTVILANGQNSSITLKPEFI